MRILYTSPLNPNRFPAAGEHIITVVSAWHGMGHTVFLVNEGSQVIPLDSLTEICVEPTNDKLVRDWRLGRAVRSTLQSYPIDVVYHRFAKSSIFPLIWSLWYRPSTFPTVKDESYPKVTVVSPSYNQAQFLEETIRLSLTGNRWIRAARYLIRRINRLRKRANNVFDVLS